MRLALITLAVTALTAPSVRAQAPVEEIGLETRVWLDRGDEPVLKQGETVRIYYRATEDAYAAIFRIDTDGRIALVFPQDPSADLRVRGGQDYRLMLPSSPVWRVNEDPGVGYFFMIASPEPLNLSAFPFDPRVGWDLAAIGDVVYEDPYLAIDDYVAQLIPDWEVVPYALDFITYNVGDTHSYPRFLCYDCHDARPYSSWNPYAVQCTTYRVVIWDDPYFYPYYRYSGSRVVVARPIITQPRYAVAARAPGDSYRPLIRPRAAPPRTVADFKEPAASGSPQEIPRRATPQATQPAPRPTLQRRPTAPSSRLPVRTPPSRPTGATAAPPAADARIVRPTRPSAPTGGVSPTPRTPTRPSPAQTPTPSTRSGAGVGATPVVPSRPSARPSTPSRPTTRPAAPSRPTARPAAPSRPSPQPSAPSRPSAQPSAPSRPAARPAAPPRAPASRPTVQPRPNNSGRGPGG